MTNRTPDVDAGTDDRYAALRIGDEDLVIYDREESGAWLQSDLTLDPAA